MAKITLRMPELIWRQETVDVPKGRSQVVREMLRARQGRISQQLSKRNEENARQLDKAARSGRMSSSLLWVAAGAILGAAAGVLLSPTEGKAVRSKVGQSLKSAKGSTTSDSSDGSAGTVHVEDPTAMGTGQVQ